MDSAAAFLATLALVLGIAAVTSVLFQRLRLPPVLGYLVAGIALGPHDFPPVRADVETVRTLSELGVILLMFSLGLGFTLRKLGRLASTAGLIVAIEVGLCLGLGYTAGQLMGWTPLESLFAGAIVSISSTMIIAKVFHERHIEGKLAEVVYGVLVVEDLVAILFIAVLTAVATGVGPSTGVLAGTLTRLVAFLAGVIVVGLFIVPRWIRWVVRLRRDETTLVASVGLCFGLALLAHTAGYSVALGAFLAGALVAEGGAGRQVEPLVRPLRDMFAAIFFVAVGMSIEPRAIPEHWGAIVVLTLVVLTGKFAGVTSGTFLAGLGTRTAVRAGLSLAQIGEFSFIIAGIGVASGAVRDFIPPVAVAVAAITALSTHWLVGRSSAVANYADRRLPRALQTYATLYGSWVESARFAARANTPAARIRRLTRFIILDAVLLATIVAGSTLAVTRGTARLAALTGFDPPAIRLGAVALALAVLFPLLYGIARAARALGILLSTMAVPLPNPGKADLGLAPRRALRNTIQIGIVLIVGAPLVAVTLPFLPAYGGPAFLGMLLLLLGLAFWRSARDLQGHVRAGATMIVEALARQNRPSTGDEGMLSEVRKILPGIGDLAQVTIGAGSPGSGQSLAELNLRGLTGASVVGLRRGEERMVFPSAREHLRDGDVLALTGTHEAIAAATDLLQGGDSSERHKYQDATVR